MRRQGSHERIYRDDNTGGWVLEQRGLCGYRMDGTWDDGWELVDVFGSLAVAEARMADMIYARSLAL